MRAAVAPSLTCVSPHVCRTLDWRLLQWLAMGSEMVEPQLHRISAPVLVVAGTVDRLLPSFEEAKRLKRELPKCSVHYASESFPTDSGQGGVVVVAPALYVAWAGWEGSDRGRAMCWCRGHGPRRHAGPAHEPDADPVRVDARADQGHRAQHRQHRQPCGHRHPIGCRLRRLDPPVPHGRIVLRIAFSFLIQLRISWCSAWAFPFEIGWERETSMRRGRSRVVTGDQVSRLPACSTLV